VVRDEFTCTWKSVRAMCQVCVCVCVCARALARGAPAAGRLSPIREGLPWSGAAASSSRPCLPTALETGIGEKKIKKIICLTFSLRAYSSSSSRSGGGVFFSLHYLWNSPESFSGARGQHHRRRRAHNKRVLCIPVSSHPSRVVLFYSCYIVSADVHLAFAATAACVRSSSYTIDETGEGRLFLVTARIYVTITTTVRRESFRSNFIISCPRDTEAVHANPSAIWSILLHRTRGSPGVRRIRCLLPSSPVRTAANPSSLHHSSGEGGGGGARRITHPPPRYVLDKFL